METKYKIRSPVTNRLILTTGKTYKDLYKQGYFTSLTGIKEMDDEILLGLDLKELFDIATVNKLVRNTINNDTFWCHWLNRHYNIDARSNCKNMSKLMKSGKNMEGIYHIALNQGYLPLVSYLLSNKLVSPFKYNLEGNKDWGHHPLAIAAGTGQLDMIKLLLLYFNNITIDYTNSIYTALDNSVFTNQIEIVQYLLDHLEYDNYTLSDILSGALKKGNIDIINILIQAGANPYNTVIDAIFSNRISVLELVLSYDVKIPNAAIAIALGLRKYNMLKLLLLDPRSKIPQDIKNKVIKYIDNKKYDVVEEILLPFIKRRDIYYEYKEKDYYKMDPMEREEQY